MASDIRVQSKRATMALEKLKVGGEHGENIHKSMT